MNSLTISEEAQPEVKAVTDKIIENEKLEDLMNRCYRISEAFSAYLRDRKSESFPNITVSEENEVVSNIDNSSYYIQKFSFREIGLSHNLTRYAPVNVLMLVFLFQNVEFALTHDYIFSYNWFYDFLKKSQEKSESKETGATDVMSRYNESKKFYLAKKQSLLKKYKNKYIAILDKKVVDFDKNFSMLADRIYKRFGNQPFFIPYVDVEEKIYRMPSPKAFKFYGK